MPTDIFEQYRQYGIVSGEELYMPSQYAIGFVEDCSLRDIAVIGIEGFLIADQRIMPLLDEIADFSSIVSPDWQAFTNQCNAAAKKFLEISSRDQTRFFSFVLANQDEWT
ncbi:hypothetical protein IQ273_19650 [Nodosilinea sp. LEGE 07298]|uniref:hypothetical protein n=1 Tax=Nodosilinea sp. LEGE 07298 TaxID=2777970 RepID=UPI00187E8EF6|nr:hypothetical protein [Nodosilinea sp. LEGE 07298]MBE9111625.1 hypothetical protein [Nodosilinea sp. LEGE 07298]